MASGNSSPESSPDNSLSALDFSQLLDSIEFGLRASSAIERGGPSGFIRTIERRGGDDLDGVDVYVPGPDSIEDLDIQATYANNQEFARKHRGKEDPRHLHVLAGYSDQYRASTGNFSLLTLSRLAVAVSVLAGDQIGATLHATFVEEDAGVSERLGYGDGRDELDRLQVLEAYDRFIKKDHSKQPEPSEPASLSSELEYLASDEADVDPDNDALIVITDGLHGAVRDKKQRLQGFSWEEPLLSLSEAFKDRFMMLWLTTPAQLKANLGYHFENNGRRVSLDPDGYKHLAAITGLVGLEKRQRIAEILSDTRHEMLDSADDTPLLTIYDLMFGEPE